MNTFKKTVVLLCLIMISLSVFLFISTNTSAQETYHFDIDTASNSFLEDDAIDKFIDMFYEIDSESSEDMRRVLKNQSTGSSDLYKEFYDKVFAFYDIIDLDFVEDISSAATAATLQNIDLCINTVSGIMDVCINYSEFVNSQNAMEQTINGIQIFESLVKTVGYADCFPSSLSLILKTTELGLNLGSYLETRYFKEAQTMYEFDLILAYWSNAELPKRTAPTILLGDNITQAEANSIYAQLYTKYYIQRMMSKLPSIKLNLKEDTNNNDIKYEIYQEINIDNIEYSIKNNEVTIEKYTNYYKEYPYHMVIPNTIDGFPVVRIEDNAFRDAGFTISSIIIPNSVKYIGDYAFYGNPCMDRVIILGSDTVLGNGVFDWELPTCSNITCNQSIGSVPIYCESDSNVRNYAENTSGFCYKPLNFDANQHWGIQPQNNTYRVYTANQLQYIAYLVNKGNHLKNYTISIEHNLYLNNNDWIPIGNSSETYYSGSFDGNNYFISGLKIPDHNMAALFGYVITSSSNFNDITLKGSSTKAGLIGRLVVNDSGDFKAENIINETKISAGTDNAGGIISEIVSAGNSSINFYSCKNIGTIDNIGSIDTRNVGGIVGVISSTKTDKYIFDSCIQNGKINQRTVGYGSGDVGGILGRMENGNLTITKCAVAGEIYAKGYGANCGGLTGPLKPHSLLVENCEVFAFICVIHNSGTPRASGLIGGCYNDYYDDDSTLLVKNTYVSAAMSTDESWAWPEGKAGLIMNYESGGASLHKIIIQNCYFDLGKAEVEKGRLKSWSALLSGNNTISTNVFSSDTYKSEVLRTNKNLYENWDFENIWTYADSGYPILRAFDCEPCFEHSFKYTIIAPTCLEDGEKKYSCINCHYYGSIHLEKDPNNHLNSETIYSVNLKSPTHHDKKHSCCGMIIETNSCTIENSKCKICGLYEMPQKNSSGYYEIYNLNNYIAFAQRINNGMNSINGILKADINLGTNNIKIGTAKSCFNGIFDGNNHTITFHFSGKNYLAPFAYVLSATIKNLKTKGSINISEQFAGGIVAYVVDGNFLIENCISEVNIISQTNDDGTHGGIIARNLAWSSSMKNCGFTGSIIGKNTTNCGGLIGWSYRTLNISNCFVAATFDINVSSGNSDTFCRNTHTLNNCYYLNELGHVNSHGAIKKSLTQFNRGEVAFLLGYPWGQNIDNDSQKENYPSISSNKVYYGYLSCESENTKIYTNNENVVNSKIDHTITDDNDCTTSCFCTICNKLVKPSLIHTFEKNCSYTVCYNEGCSVTRPYSDHVYDAPKSLNRTSHIIPCKNCEYFTKTHHIWQKCEDAENSIVSPYGVQTHLCTECTATLIDKNKDLKFSDAQLSLSDDLTIRYRVNISLFENSNYKNLTAKFKFNNKETLIEDYYIQDSYLIFSLNNIAPHQMNDTIQAKLCAEIDDCYIEGFIIEYSVKQYCYNTLKRATGNSYSDLRTLLVDLLNYGAKSQEYANYKTDNLVNADLTPEQASWASSDDLNLKTRVNTSYYTVKQPSVQWRGAGLNLRNSIAVRFIFSAEEIENLIIEIGCGSKSWKFNSDDFVKTSDGNYYILFDKINAAKMKFDIYISAYQNGTQVSNTLRYSIESYVYSMQNSSDQKLVELVKAMMKYGNSAYKYSDIDLWEPKGDDEGPVIPLI